MDKLASIKLAETNGALAALVEHGLAKIASEEDFDIIADTIAQNLSDEWGLDEMLSKTADVLEEYDEIMEGVDEDGEEEFEDEEDLDKEAEEIDEAALMAAYGELSLMKEAGEISEEEFEKEAFRLSDITRGAKRLYNTDVTRKSIKRGAKNLYEGAKDKARGAGRGYIDALKGKGSKAAKKNVTKGRENIEGLRAQVAREQEKFEAFRDHPLMKKLRKKDRGKYIEKMDARGGKLRGAKTSLKDGEKNLKDLEDNLSKIRRRQGMAIGGTAVGVGAAGLGAKSLYDKYSK